MTQILARPELAQNAPVTAARAHAARSFRPDIEGMRAFAVLSVVFYHAHLLGIRGGFVGVDVFFVISGFLITRQLVEAIDRRGLRALPTFYTRRIRRLLPLSVVVVLATVGAARLWAPALQVKSIATDAIYTSFYGMNYRLAITGTQYLHQSDSVSPLQHFWSLAVEEQFYVFWPLLIGAAALVGRRGRRPLLVALLLGLTAVSFYLSVVVTRTSQPWAYFSLHTRAWEMGLGALVALTAGWLARMPRLLGELAAVAGLAAVIGSAFLYSDATRYPGSAAALPVLGATVLIAGGCGPRRRVERLLGEPMLQCIGKVSYAWYLWHWPMLILGPAAVGHALTVQDRIVVVWVSFVLAIASYFAIEDPVRHLPKPNWQWFTGGAIASLAVCAIGSLVITTLPSLVGSGASVTVVQADTASPAVLAQMHAALSAGVATVAAPRNLTPSPATAATDRPAADHTNCHADFATIAQGPCVYGDPHGAHTLVLMGDSHADVWLPAFDVAGRAGHWKIVDWTKSACPAANLTVYNSSLKRTYTECDAWRRDVLRRLGALRPDRVLLSSAENLADGSVSPATWSAATLSTMDAVRRDTGAAVSLMADVPVPGYLMPDCVAAHLSQVSACTFSVDKAYAFPKRHAQASADAARAGYQVIDPQSWICTGQRCPAVVGNLLVYRDDTHLTATFSRWLAPMVSPLLTVAGHGK